MKDARNFFVSECAALVRSMPLKKAVPFLRGLLQIAGDSKEVASLRHIFTRISDSDQQLKLISQNEQLNLFTPPTRKKGSKQ